MQTIRRNLHSQNGTNQRIFPQMPFSNHLTASPVCGKKVVIDFNGGNLTSDAGVMLLSEIERQTGLIDSLTECIKDSRRSYSVDHSIKDVFAQRVFQIGCGYEDANDSNTLRTDPVMKMAVGRLPQDEDQLASQPTISRFENMVSNKDLVRIGYTLIDNFIQSYQKEPKVIVLDFDDTNDPVHGRQQLSLFNGYYGNTCYQPLHVYEGLSGKLITTVLRPGKRPDGREILAYLKRIVNRIRKHWPNTLLVYRGDSHYSSPEVFDYIQSHANMVSVCGLTSNNVLMRNIQDTIGSAKRLYEYKLRKVKLYHSFYYKANSWTQARRVVAKVEMSERGLNVRFISTDMFQAKAKSLYENIYCGRGNMELMIKEHKTYTKSDRTSCHSFKANQLRLFLHSAAYVLLHRLRTQVLKGTELSNATLETLRLKLLKIGGRVVELKTKIKVHLPNAYPYKPYLKKCFDIFDHLRQTERIRLC